MVRTDMHEDENMNISVMHAELRMTPEDLYKVFPEGGSLSDLLNETLAAKKQELAAQGITLTYQVG